MPRLTTYTPRAFCWTELLISDALGAKAFYRAVLGWEADDRPVEPGAVSTMLRIGGDEVA